MGSFGNNRLGKKKILATLRLTDLKIYITEYTFSPKIEQINTSSAK